MHVIADTKRLLSDGIITAQAASIMEARGRETMVSLAINAVLSLGILFATFGLIFWLANALAVAVCGFVLLGTGLLILMKTGDTVRMLGNASALIGSGMLIAGAAIELIDKYADIAGWVMIPVGLVIAGLAFRAFVLGGLTTRFVQGTIGLMGVALHLGGLAHLIGEAGATGIIPPLFYLYATASLVLAGWLIDVRLITALAIVPFAQALDTSTFYFHAAYVFYSPESTLTILQMSMAVVAGLYLANTTSERTARHARIGVSMAFIVANLCALVGTLWGDMVGEHIWGPGRYTSRAFADYETFQAARDAFRDSALHISADVYTVVWGLALAGIVFWAAHRSNRALFNAGITFAALHVYTQIFETFFDEPLAYVIAGFSAVALAWGMWRLNQAWLARTSPA